MSLLDDLFRTGTLRVLDHALAQSLRRLDPATPEAVLAAAALASFAVGQGNAAFDPARPQLLFDADIDWPAPQAWLEALSESRWVDAPDADSSASSDTPLVLENGLLYLRRYRQYEYRLALRLRQIAARVPDAGDLAALASLFAALFPEARNGDDCQAHAAASALLRSLLLVTGGPGTGKTTTIARLLLLLVAQAQREGGPPPRIALAAPTGRAAERMAESLIAAVSVLRQTPGVEVALCDALPTRASTLHRLLGTIPDSPRFRFDAGHPLPFDIVVVDEASMVDLPLMCKLVEAVPDGARLVLLGDPDQLPSVEAGDVLAAIMGAASDDDITGEALAPLLGGGPAKSPIDARPLAGHHVRLRRGYRQAESFNLSPLALAVREGDTDTTLALLRGGQLAGVHFHENLFDPLQAHREALLTHWRALADIDDPAAALAQAGRLRLLTAVREGAQGARGLNARIEEALAAHRGQAPAYFNGRLLLVTENSYRQRLFNGDIGICLRGDKGAPVAWFPGDAETGPRPFHPGALPAHESAFAMTVHKAQGSEFDSVWLQLPRQPTRVLTRELVYTALTRARREVHVCASAESLRQALARRVERISGLAARLR
ncbi:exodeoxyribonuclease V subunit alpha [Pseudoxanthomonas yeongjuensis]|uniref:exodeoxyribonuclease V subunit alpha n=1 Tax=Pseudoxanthomonas yeongjuensis TaxID=377616 RepID=UPI001391916B|nr:exodeoxyribonuclease V subunit alpha [Pseudoxanthomonas yeongjuensis]KAF1716668.1 exodeoxyribonuclease V subunit alpha [Pseudoxanthomonas yeongjuensis]